jgi:hypothetical protein
MRFAPFAIVAALLIAVQAQGADAPASNDKRPCVDVQIGNDRTAYLNCLNDEMQRRVEHERSTPQIAPPIDAHSSSTQVGTFNDAAAGEHMGNAYGVSPVPQRPPARIFVNPVGGPPSR